MTTTQHDAETVSPVVELSPEEDWADFDAQCRSRLGISGEEFLRRLDAGEFEDAIDDPINHPGVGFLAMLSRGVR